MNRSWEKTTLLGVHLEGRNLSGLDFTDARLDGSDLSGARLQEANFAGASLRSCILDNAELIKVVLANADLSEASLRDAKLQEADLLGAKLVGADFYRTKLRGAKLSTDIERADWAFCENWRSADLDEEIRNRLHRIYGSEPKPSATRVLMILWEFPPAVSGGGWTAAYHLIRNLRQKGCHITVLTPWKEAGGGSPFGREVPIIHTDMQGEEEGPQGSPMSNSAYSGYSAYGHSIYAVNLFTRKVMRDYQFWKDRDKDFHVIHAHDWLTFEVARWLAGTKGVPWIAHFHSTEMIRQTERDRTKKIEKIERGVCEPWAGHDPEKHPPARP
jgi:hypothetical protein